MIREGFGGCGGLQKKTYSSQYYRQSIVLNILWHVWIVHSQDAVWAESCERTYVVHDSIKHKKRKDKNETCLR